MSLAGPGRRRRKESVVPEEATRGREWSLRIAQLAPCWISVPPQAYGGTELVVSELTESLVERGHEVTLFATGDSKTSARLRSYYPQALGTLRLVTEPRDELLHVLHAYCHTAEFDVIHDHTFPFGPALGAQLPRPPVVHTLHVPFDQTVRPLYELVGRRLSLVAISHHQRACFPDLNYLATVHHGIPVQRYPFKSEKEDYLLLIGRMSPDKGVHLAVEAAARLGRRLVILTKMAEPAELRYFETEVRPRLTPAVEILSGLPFGEKVRLLAGAACLLMPVLWPEPFGLVMPEALACGTPVVAFRRGSVSEIVDQGVTGFVVEDLDGLVEAIQRVETIEAAACRAAAEARFSTARMVAGYEAAYRKVLFPAGSVSGLL